MKRRYRIYTDLSDPERKEFFDIILTVKGIGFLWSVTLDATISEVQIKDLHTGVITQGDPYYETQDPKN